MSLGCCLWLFELGELGDEANTVGEESSVCVHSFSDLSVGHIDVRNCLIGAGEITQSAKCLFQNRCKTLVVAVCEC